MNSPLLPCLLLTWLTALEPPSSTDDPSPAQLVFRGQLQESGEPFSGEAQVRLALVRGNDVIWSHNASPDRHGRASEALQVAVTEGALSIELGASGLVPLPANLDLDDPNLRLRLWVDLGEGDERMARDYPLPSSRPLRAAAPLKRSPRVVQAKIERKRQKLAQRTSPPKNPKQRERERYLRKLDENGEIPPNGLVRAKEHVDAMWERQQKESGVGADAGLWSWEWLGPGNIGGRVRAILVHPTQTDTMWVGGVAGGIWKTTNGGASWTPLNDFLPSLAVTSLVMDPNDPDVIYAATGEGFSNFDALIGAGIFKSTDGGSTWSQMGNTFTYPWINRLEHHPSNSGELYGGFGFLGLSRGQIRRSTDGGAFWTKILDTPNRPTDIKIHPTQPQYMLVGTATDVYFSQDAGATWTRESDGGAGKLPSSPGRCEVAFASSIFGLVGLYVLVNRNQGELWFAQDPFGSGGASWTLKNTGNNFLGGQGWYNNALFVRGDGSLIVVGGIDLWRSTDFGSTFTRISDWAKYHTGQSAHADHHIIVRKPDTISTVFVGNDGGIQKANNIDTVTQTSGWTNLANNLGITQFYGGSAAPDGSVIVGGTQDNDSLRFRPQDGVQAWYQAETGDGGFAAIDFSNPATIFTEYTNLQIEKSTDGGQTYSSATTGLTDAGSNALFIAPFSMDPNDPTRLIAGGTSIWHTINSAGTWHSLAGPRTGSPRCSAIDIAVGDSQTIWVGYDDGKVSRTTNGGSTWSDRDDNSPGLPDRFVTDIAINPNNSDEVFVTFSGFAGDNVWFTDDDGATWSQRTGPQPDHIPPVPVNTVRFHPADDDWVFIGTDLGVFASEDQGLNWSVTPRYGDFEGPVHTEVSELFWQNDEYLIAATHGRGMFRARPLTVIYVDLAWNGAEDGSQSNPYNTIQEALDAAGNGTAIVIQSGQYLEAPMTIHKRGKISVTGGAVIIK